MTMASTLVTMMLFAAALVAGLQATRSLKPLSSSTPTTTATTTATTASMINPSQALKTRAYFKVDFHLDFDFEIIPNPHKSGRKPCSTRLSTTLHNPKVLKIQNFQEITVKTLFIYTVVLRPGLGKGCSPRLKADFQVKSGVQVNLGFQVKSGVQVKSRPKRVAKPVPR